MPNKAQRKTSRKKGGSGGANVQLAMLNELRQLRRDNDLMIPGRLPAVPDIPRLRLKRKKVYTFVKSAQGVNITPSTTIDQMGVVTGTLSLTSDSASFQALFDQWRIVQMSVSFTPNTVSTSYASLYTVIDYDDGTNLTGLPAADEYDTLEVTAPGRFVTRTFAPQAAMAAYSGTFTSFGSSLGGQWFDVASPNVIYYGLKWYLPAISTALASPVYSINIEIIYNFCFSR